MDDLTKREAFRIVFEELNRFADARLAGRTAHDAECVAVEMKVNLGTGDFCGEMILKGARRGETASDKLLNNIFNDETTNTVEFNTLDEFLEVLGLGT